jgi:hypothetical protein
LNSILFRRDLIEQPRGRVMKQLSITRKVPAGE